ncbi:NAD(P)/FAD-dependent oxidoreductase [Denitrobaculum tricleocarpae]|uniref:FAD-dependent oxidoreductase n=1 Tax=Denitrobaculum tricleocarpae TaxID=2591009 RepID=A0A545TKI6_9PROT|nr:FAD-dependent oxidoreductase [Denitrobaculum tricleocarpae]TQV77739.1 FAD-dependent oxidoreductase [Denitrobaculum tricleocarpae]
MKIAVVGTGISGLGAAWALAKEHQVVVYEQGDRLGGHANTVSVEVPGADRSVDVDIGFIVYNKLNYPNLVRLFQSLDVPTEDSDMSFSVSLGGGSFEYEGSLSGLLAQPQNLLKPAYWRMLNDLRRFYREAPGLLDGNDEIGPSLGTYLERNNYGPEFVKGHLLPMGAAIWSTPPEQMLDYPVKSFVAFCENHRLLSYTDRPQWRTVTGGSRNYVSRVADSLQGRERNGEIRLNAAVVGLQRHSEGVSLRDISGQTESFDQVVLACHADQTLAILGQDAAAEERNILSAFRYSDNRVVLHSDRDLMPRRKRAWASWNYLSEQPLGHLDDLSLTYWMNRLQNIDHSVPLFVTLNPGTRSIKGTIHQDLVFKHPLFDRAALEAQQRLKRIQGQSGVWFCGSYFGHGFHEDGLQSGLTVAAALGSPPAWFEEITPRSTAARHAVPSQPADLGTVMAAE